MGGSLLLLGLAACSKQQEQKVSAVYACNIEFKGTDEDSVRRVHVCRQGAELTYAMAVERAKQPRMVPDGYHSGEGRSQLLADFSQEVRERTRVRCMTQFESSDDKLACLAGVRNFQRIDFERVLFADASGRGKWMTVSAVREALGPEERTGGSEVQGAVTAH